MMKHNLKGCVLAMALCVVLSGCGNAIPEMTNEQRAQISEYAVEKILEYDTGRDSRLVDLSLYPTPTQTPEPTPVPTPEGMDEVADTPVIGQEQESSMTISQALKLEEGLSLEYVGYDVVDAYPSDDNTSDSMKVSAAMGKKLLVLRFQLLNASPVASEVEIIDPKRSCLVTVNEEYSQTASMTLMLEDDLLTYVGTLQPDEGKNLVMLTEYKEEELLDVATIQIVVRDGDTASKVNLF